jgi:D-threo-aldose 1-dehydrogenase
MVEAVGAGDSVGLPTRNVGRTEVRLTELGLGTAPLGNLYREMSDENAAATVQAALAHGMRYFDTAPYYGFGLAESRLGVALADAAGTLVSSKVGRVLEPAPQVRDTKQRHGFCSASPFEPVFDYTFDGVMRSWESTVTRLKCRRMDIAYVHDIGRRTHGALHEVFLRQLIDGGLRALEQLREQQLVSAIGIGVNEIDVCVELMERTSLDVVLLAGRYTLLEQGALTELFPLCKRAGTSVVIGGPFNSGVLAVGSSGQATYDYGAVAPDVLLRVQRLERVCRDYCVPLAAAALQFPLAHPVVASVIPGLDSAARVAEATRWYRIRIPDEFWDALRTQGLIDAAAPTPRTLQ